MSLWLVENNQRRAHGWGDGDNLTGEKELFFDETAGRAKD